MQITNGLYSILSSPVIYDFVQDLAWGQRGQIEYVDKYLQPKKNDHLLDVGCGTGRLLRYLPPCSYLGIDLSAQYIEYAKRRTFEGKADFLAANVNALPGMNLPSFSIISAIGLIHHLDDPAVSTFLETARKLLGRGGRLVTVDPGYYEGQGRISRFIVNHDRGRNMRTAEAYKSLFTPLFSQVELHISSRLVRLPVNGFVSVCTV